MNTTIPIRYSCFDGQMITFICDTCQEPDTTVIPRCYARRTCTIHRCLDNNIPLPSLLCDSCRINSMFVK